jgi:hypothetical protein
LVSLGRRRPVDDDLVALVLSVALGVLAIVPGAEARAPREVAARPGIVAKAFLSPRVILFGDPLTARFDVVVDRGRIDPRLVRLEADFDPFRPVGPVKRSRRDARALTLLRFTILLRCLSAACLPRLTEKREFEFPKAGILIGHARRLARFERIGELRLPPIGVAPRVSATELERYREVNPLQPPGASRIAPNAADVAGLWRESSAPLPSVSYRLPPDALVALLLALAVLLAVAAVVLVLQQVRAARPVPVVPAAPMPGSSLEHALGLLDLALADGQVAEQRKALELLARELGDVGKETLAWRARRLAWAEDDPARAEARALAKTVRAGINGGRDDAPA